MNPWKEFFKNNEVRIVWPEREYMEKKVWFAADLHNSHTNILDFSPSRIDALGLTVDKAKLAAAYKSYREDKKDTAAKDLIGRTTQEMNDAIVRKWNEKVGYSDDVYIIGDVSFAKKEGTVKFLDRLNGRLHLIRGNHERDTDTLERWEWVKDYYEGTFDGIKVVMFHFPIYEWNKMHRGAFHLHGHIHGKQTPIGGRILDVAMESINDVVIEWKDVRRMLETKEIRVHHDADRESTQND